MFGKAPWRRRVFAEISVNICDERFACNTELNTKKTYCVHHTDRPLHLLEIPLKRVAFAAVWPGGLCNPSVAIWMHLLAAFAQLFSYSFGDAHLLGAHASIPYRAASSLYIHLKF